ncbi:hypothetical protein CPB84DRAFT_1117301 [Gymnopilus junonius]|uniref:Secreted protein n=1 Tax=Gymnopilus junonius TaxID=109634 RepID=A0A9P5NK24_GYMJU|nr:hypothetical protein CPB84DRAFT_1117301 [Gymnopilus junonius]
MFVGLLLGLKCLTLSRIRTVKRRMSKNSTDGMMFTSRRSFILRRTFQTSILEDPFAIQLPPIETGIEAQCFGRADRPVLHTFNIGQSGLLALAPE